MKNFKTVMLVILFSMVNARSSLLAMEEAAKSISDYFPDFKTISLDLLEEFAENAPEDPSHCGKIHRGYAIRWDHWSSDSRSLESMCRDIKINPAPQKFAGSINDCTISFEARVDSLQELDEARLRGIVSLNIDKGKPVMAYYQNEVNILLTTIVGYNKEPSHLLLLKTEGHGRDRFLALKFSTFVRMMDLSPIFLKVGVYELDEFTKPKAVSLIEGEIWSPYTFLVFEKKSQEKPKVLPPENVIEEKPASPNPAEHSINAIQPSSEKIRRKPRVGWFSSILTCTLQ